MALRTVHRHEPLEVGAEPHRHAVLGAAASCHHLVRNAEGPRVQPPGAGLLAGASHHGAREAAVDDDPDLRPRVADRADPGPDLVVGDAVLDLADPEIPALDVGGEEDLGQAVRLVPGLVRLPASVAHEMDDDPVTGLGLPPETGEVVQDVLPRGACRGIVGPLGENGDVAVQYPERIDERPPHQLDGDRRSAETDAGLVEPVAL